MVEQIAKFDALGQKQLQNPLNKKKMQFFFMQKCTITALYDDALWCTNRQRKLSKEKECKVINWKFIFTEKLN